MEKWTEILDGIIPLDNYQTNLMNGEDNGLIIELNGNKHKVVINFGVVKAVRMLDEGIVQNNLYSENEVERLKKSGFQNVIYEITDGEFEKQIENISEGLWDTFDAKHYIVITQNYNIDIITECKPEILIQKVLHL